MFLILAKTLYNVLSMTCILQPFRVCVRDFFFTFTHPNNDWPGELLGGSHTERLQMHVADKTLYKVLAKIKNIF
jgi:hypothetical protein